MNEPKALTWPELADQPTVQWPEALLEPKANTQPVHTAEQVAAPQTTEPYRDPRKPPPVGRAISLDAAPEAPPTKPAGRVLPVIEDPKPIKVEAAEDVVKASPTVRARRAKTVRVAEPITAEPESLPEAVLGPTIAVKLSAGRRGADRLARADFKRGERWKARLPIAVFKRTKRKRIAP